MPTKENIYYNIMIDKKLLSSSLERVLTECTNIVFFGFAAIDNLKEQPDVFSSTPNFLNYHPILSTMTLEEGKVFFKNWILKKGFEDLIKGVNLMLIDICKVISKREDLIKTNPETIEDLNEILNDPKISIDKKHLPELLKIIDPYLCGELSYIDVIHSINRVRRCLVHRDGIVKQADINDKDSLILEWKGHKITYEENGKQVEMNPLMLMTAKGSVVLSEITSTKEFKENERIEIDYQTFQELAWNCFRFGIDLIHKLKFEKKS